MDVHTKGDPTFSQQVLLPYAMENLYKIFMMGK